MYLRGTILLIVFIVVDGGEDAIGLKTHSCKNSGSSSGLMSLPLLWCCRVSVQKIHSCGGAGNTGLLVASWSYLAADSRVDTPVVVMPVTTGLLFLYARISPRALGILFQTPVSTLLLFTYCQRAQ
jgi:hypothetical protein